MIRPHAHQHWACCTTLRATVSRPIRHCCNSLLLPHASGKIQRTRTLGYNATSTLFLELAILWNFPALRVNAPSFPGSETWPQLGQCGYKKVITLPPVLYEHERAHCKRPLQTNKFLHPVWQYVQVSHSSGVLFPTQATPCT